MSESYKNTRYKLEGQWIIKPDSDPSQGHEWEAPLNRPNEIVQEMNVCIEVMEEQSQEIEGLHETLAAVTAERDALRRIADGMATNVRYMVERIDEEQMTDADITWEFGQWAVNLIAWEKELAAIDAAKGGVE